MRICRAFCGASDVGLCDQQRKTHFEAVFAFASSDVDFERFPTQYHVKLNLGTLFVARTRQEPSVLEICSRAQFM